MTRSTSRYTAAHKARTDSADTILKAVLADPPKIEGPDIREARRAYLHSLRHLYPIPGPAPEVDESYRQVPTRDGAEIRVKVYQPKQPPKEGSPLIVQYHEGGFAMGDLTDEDLNCRMFARDLGAVCLNVEYR